MLTKLIVMKKLLLFLLALVPFALYCQQPSMDSSRQKTAKPKKPEHRSIGIGIKAGFNFADVTNASSINSSTRAGFHAGLFLAPTSHGIMGSRTELIFSQHGYNYKTDTTNGSVNLDYIMLTQMMAIHITKYFDIHWGGYTAFLLHVKADTTQKIPGMAGMSSMLSFYNRFDYGLGAGVEIHPFMGIIIGARYQYSFSNLYKSFGAGSMTPSFAPPNVNLKNNVILISVGYRF
jgi:opacity protein-like surface antigen